MLNRINNLLPTFKSFELASPKQMAKNLTKIAIPAIVLFGLAFGAYQAYAGPGAYAACMSACMLTCGAATSGGFLPACAAACAQYCAPAGVAPTI